MVPVDLTSNMVESHPDHLEDKKTEGDSMLLASDAVVDSTKEERNMFSFIVSRQSMVS